MTAFRSQPLAWEREIQYAEPTETSSGYAFEWQLAFHRSRALFKGFSGPVGSGKSRALCYEALKLSYENRGCVGVIGAPTYPMLRDSTLKAFRELLEENEVPYRFHKSKNTLNILESDSQILFRSLDNFERIRGLNLAWFGIDELTYCKPESWLRLEARLRDPKAKHRCGFASWTPKGFDWVYDRFIGPDRKPNYEVFRASQNVALPQEYYASLETSYSERFYRQEALGEYLAVFGGQAYYAFRRPEHVMAVTYKPEHSIWWALDFNVNAMCSVIGQTINGNVRVLEELVGSSNTLAACEEFLERSKPWWAPPAPDGLPEDDEDVEEFLRRLKPSPLKLYIYGDASGAAHKTSSSRTDWQIVKDFFGRHTDKFQMCLKVPSSNGPVKDRVNCVNAMLRNYAGERRLFLSPNCRELAKDFEQVAWKASPNGNPISELNKSDPMRTHLTDALGYYIVREFPMRGQSGERGGPALL
jgi:phage terminase large subunit